MKDQVTLFYTTVSSLEEAQTLARGMLEAKVAACVNLSSPLTSLYLWEREVKEGAEVSLLIKTSPARAGSLKEWLLENHPYDVPAILIWEAETSEAFRVYVKDGLQTQ